MAQTFKMSSSSGAKSTKRHEKGLVRLIIPFVDPNVLPYRPDWHQDEKELPRVISANLAAHDK